MRFWLGVMPLFAMAQLASAQTATEYPPIKAIVYAGNSVTREITMQRELVIAVGEPADPERIDRSRQAIQDLGLFREVKVRQQVLDDGVRVIFTVREKWYVLPIPRIEANSDGDTGLGMQIRWDNVWGLNHSLSALAVRRDYQREDKDSSYNYHFDYNIPFLRGTRNSLAFSASHSKQTSTTLEGDDYQESNEGFSVVMTHSLNKDGPPSQGWKVGGGLLWKSQTSSGEFAPEPEGSATGLIGKVSYNDVHDHIYSLTGERFLANISGSWDQLLSDYSYLGYYAQYRRYMHLGQVEHQSLHFLADLGGYHAGPLSREPKAFELGGSGMLRGYDREVIEGDFMYYGSVEYLRPIHWDWLRLLTLFEAGSALRDVDYPSNEIVYASVGVGLRMQITWFVNLQFEIGVAYPLVSGNQVRFFAGAF